MKIVCTLVDEYLTKSVELCDVIEIRLDCLGRRFVNKTIETVEKDLIFTCRREVDGGKYKNSESERLGLLSRYVMYADYIDIEHDVNDEFFKAVRSAGVRVLESYYGRNSGYKYLEDLIEGKKGDIFKVVIWGEGGKIREGLRLILRLHSEYENLIAFLVGERFGFTTIISSLVGNPLIYCHTGIKAFPGQYSVEEALKLRKMFAEG